MNRIRLFCLIALAALMATALAGASSAMAESTSLCTADENPCAVANQVAHVHETTNGVVIATPVGRVLCTVLTLRHTVTNNLGIPLRVTSTTTYSNCVRHKSGGGTEACTVTEKNGPAEVAILKEGHETAKVTEEIEFNVKCGFFINCTYNGEGLVATAKGPLLSSETNGEILLDNVVLHVVSGFCPSTSELNFTTTPLTATYISS